MASNVKAEEVEGDMLSMIDVVFLLLIFFLVGAKIIPPQAELTAHLPTYVGGQPPPEPVDLPLEQRLEMKAEEIVVVNGRKFTKQISVWIGDRHYGTYFNPVFASSDAERITLRAQRQAIFYQAQTALINAGTQRDPNLKVLTFIAPDLRVPYDDVIQALDCIVGADITEITFAGKVSDLDKMFDEDGIVK